MENILKVLTRKKKINVNPKFYTQPKNYPSRIQANKDISDKKKKLREFVTITLCYWKCYKKENILPAENDNREIQAFNTNEKHWKPKYLSKSDNYLLSLFKIHICAQIKNYRIIL